MSREERPTLIGGVALTLRGRESRTAIPAEPSGAVLAARTQRSSIVRRA